MEIEIPIEQSDLTTAVRSFLRLLLDHGVVDALFVPLETPEGIPIPTLVTDCDLLEKANPFIPLMPINNARAFAHLTGKNPPAHLGAVLRPCEIRALVELVKLKQASLAEVTIISMDCLGTFELSDYQAFRELKEDGLFSFFPEMLFAACEGREPELNHLSLRTACQICVKPTSDQADVYLHMFGCQPFKSLVITLQEELAASLPLPVPAGDSACTQENGEKALEKLLALRRQKRSQEFGSIREKLNSNGGVASFFTACTRCHNCMTACPICYCKTCLFKTVAFNHEPAYYLSAAKRKGAQRMLGDTLLFHLTRLSHMSTSCVSCGMCTSACPVEIPVGMLFSAVGEQVQAVFEYIPGHDVSEKLPLVTFQPDEWSTIGEVP